MKISKTVLGTFQTCCVLAALSLMPIAASAQNAPPSVVSVVQIKSEPIPVVEELPGRVAATRTAEVRARVTGILQERVFQQGKYVEKGDLLYQIDPQLFKVRVDQAKASLQRAQATLANARRELKRQETLKKRNVSSAAQYDTAVVAVQQANADVALAEATLAEAEINLQYTHVTAPISGIIGSALVTEGALVQANGSENLALIQRIDRVYVDFKQSVLELRNLKRAVANGDLQSPNPGEISVGLVFDDGTVYGHLGKLLFSSASVDASTGQVTLRATFPNPEGELLPGMYVRTRIQQAVMQKGIAIPQRAVVRADDGSAQVYVVSDDGIVAVRPVQLGKVVNGKWIVQSGLGAGEKVIVSGLQKVAPNAKVKAEIWQPSQDDTAAPAKGE
jgi:membrane fusion protein (multidrug efflux system)